MSDPKPFTLVRHLNRALSLNGRLVDLQLAGLTHGDSLIQPGEGGNCLNWLLGHVVDSRVYMLELAGLPLPIDGMRYERYKRESEPIRLAEEALPLEELVAALGATQAPLQEWLANAIPQQLDAVRDGQSRTLIEEIAFLVWHETTHIGQLEQFRRLAGHTDKVI